MVEVVKMIVSSNKKHYPGTTIPVIKPKKDIEGTIFEVMVVRIVKKDPIYSIENPV